MAKVIEVDTREQLQGYRMWWNRLLEETPGATFFQTFDWLDLYWQHFGADQRLRVLAVEAAGQVIGFVPLCVRSVPHRLTTLRTLSYPLDDWGTSYSPIGQNSAACLTMAMRHVASGPRDWDNIELRGVLHDTVDRGRTERAMALAGLTATRSEYLNSSIVDTGGTWQAYLASRPPKVRHEMRRHLRRADNHAELEFVRYRPRPLTSGDGDPAWHLFDECQQVAAASWQAGVTEGNTLCHPRYRAFYRDAHAAAARLGMVDLCLLRLAGRPIAFAYNYHHQGRVFGLRMGFDAAHAPSGAGTVLMLLTLRDSFARGDESLELGGGDQVYKRRVRTRVVTSSQLSHVPEFALKPQLVRAAGWIGQHGRRLASAALG